MNQMKLLAFVLISLSWFITNGEVSGAEKNNQQPNIIVMMVDDMGFAGPSIAPYGNPHYKTPGMNRLAREGMLFSDFHASGAICSATRSREASSACGSRSGPRSTEGTSSTWRSACTTTTVPHARPVGAADAPRRWLT